MERTGPWGVPAGWPATPRDDPEKDDPEKRAADMSTERSAARALALAGAAGACALALLAACGGGGDPAATPGATTGGTTTAGTTAAPPPGTEQVTDFNDVDVAFAQRMIQHHELAVTLAGLAGTRASDPEVKELAAEIRSTRAPQIAAMTGWLTAWGKPTEPMGTGQEIPGMAAQSPLGRLQTAEDAEFDRTFSQIMVTRHEEALRTAETELEGGLHPGARELAENVETTLRSETERMRKILDRL
ncbi:DUF305 domain-containing protein [Planomonospora corallina]|uniref:DUF305 domain-containing protein n=1 Tax=Planomonospora corallina TaxID=1806052 RepID=A0ABV8I5A9_9ACTN